MVAAARIGKDRDGDGDVIVATMVLFMPTTTIPGRDRCIKDGATSDGLLMMMLGAAEMVPRRRVTSTTGPFHTAIPKLVLDLYYYLFVLAVRYVDLL